MYKKSLLCCNGSDGNHRSLSVGIELAKAFGVDLNMISVEGELPKYAGTGSAFDA